MVSSFFNLSNIDLLIKEGESLYLMTEEEIELIFKGDIYTVLSENKEEG